MRIWVRFHCDGRRELNRWLRQTSGQDLIEYALFAAFVSLTAYAGANGLETSVNNWYRALGGNIAAKSNCSPKAISASGGTCNGSSGNNAGGNGSSNPGGSNAGGNGSSNPGGNNSGHAANAANGNAGGE